MLGKLFKHELKGTSKVMLLLFGIITAITVLAVITLCISPNAGSAISSTILVLYILSLVAIYIVAVVYVCWHFYKTTYSDQGYLTHTLPVGPLAILHSKLLTALLWIVVTTILIALSLFAMLTAATGGAVFSITPEEWDMLMHSWDSENFLPLPWFIVYMFVFAVLAILHFIMMVYAAASVGQLFSNNKLAFSVVAGVLFYFAEQLISVIALLTVLSGFFRDIASAESGIDVVPVGSFTTFLNGSLFVTIAFIIAYYLISAVIIRKHVNLD